MNENEELNRLKAEIARLKRDRNELLIALVRCKQVFEQEAYREDILAEIEEALGVVA